MWSSWNTGTVQYIILSMNRDFKSCNKLPLENSSLLFYTCGERLAVEWATSSFANE